MMEVIDLDLGGGRRGRWVAVHVDAVGHAQYDGVQIHGGAGQGGVGGTKTLGAKSKTKWEEMNLLGINLRKSYSGRPCVAKGEYEVEFV